MEFLTGQKSSAAVSIPSQVSAEISAQKHPYLSQNDTNDLAICYVLRKVSAGGSIVSFEMYDWNTGEFIISSTTFDGYSYLITSIENCHERSSVVVDEMNIDYLGRVVQNNALGLSYSCYDHADCKLCSVIYSASFSNSPVNFRVKMHSPLQMNEGFRTGGFNSYFRKARNLISQESDDEEEVLSTRPPVFNTEVNTFLTNFGGRIRQASFSNCIVTSSSDMYKICIRHGKISSDKYIFDFRHLSKVAAIGVFTTIHISKLLVAV